MFLDREELQFGSCVSGTNYDINSDGISVIDAQEEAVCDALRANGVTIFSVFVNSGTAPGTGHQILRRDAAGERRQFRLFFLGHQ